MILFDINILVNAHRPDSSKHKVALEWIETSIRSFSPFAIASFVTCGFVRLVTNHRIFVEPTPLTEALLFVDDLMGQENCRLVEPGKRHWEIFCHLAKNAGATANLVSDAYLAAIAVENGCTIASFDADFRKFPGLKFEHIS